MIDAIVAIEDRRFYSHHGIDPVRIAAAGWRNFRAGRILEGGSTITQQLARASQLTPARTYERKLREIMLAAQLEERYTKSQILEEYLNTVYLGEGYYGVEAASRGYFGKSASDLAPHEAALLAALVRSPSNDAPCVGPDRALSRRNLVLRLMRDQGRISDEAFQVAKAARHSGRARIRSLPAACSPTARIRACISRKKSGVSCSRSSGATRSCAADCGSTRPTIRRCSATRRAAVTTRIAEIAKSRPAARDLQGSFVAMDPVTGDVLALVGGRDFKASSFNRATQARRQAGSAFKPIIYAAALERGYSPGTILRDLDTPIETGDAPAWLPSGESRAVRVHAEARAQGLEQSSRRAAASARRGQHRGLLRAAAGHRVRASDGAVAGARDRRGDAARADLGVYGIRQPRDGLGAATHHAGRGRAGGHDLRLARTAHAGDQPDDRVPDVEHARRRHLRRNGSRRATPRGSSCRRRGRPERPTTTPMRGSSATRHTW